MLFPVPTNQPYRCLFQPRSNNNIIICLIVVLVHRYYSYKFAVKIKIGMFHSLIFLLSKFCYRFDL